MAPRNYQLQYFAMLREWAGIDEEELSSSAGTPRELFKELRDKRGFPYGEAGLRVAINGDFADFDQILAEGDQIAFIPPVSGG